MSVSDDGINWQHLGQLPYQFGKFCVFENKIYALTDHGILTSSSDGLNWITEAFQAPAPGSFAAVLANDYGLVLLSGNSIWRRAQNSTVYQKLPIDYNCHFFAHSSYPSLDCRLVDSFLYIPCYKQITRFNLLSNTVVDLSGDFDFPYSAPYFAFDDKYLYAAGASQPGYLWRLDLSEINGTRHLNATAFIDENQNNLQDPGEKPVPNLIMKLGKYQYVTGDAGGHFQLDYIFPFDTLRPLTNNIPYVASITPDAVGLTGLDNNITFAFHLVPDQKDLVVDLAASPFRPGFTSQVNLTVKNSGTVAQSAHLTVWLDPLLHLESSTPQPTQVFPDSLIWDLGALESWDSRTFQLTVRTDMAAQIGQLLSIQALATPVKNDQTPLNNLNTFQAHVRGAYDPNEKSVEPGTYTNTDFSSGAPLVYTIQFQNTGNEPAEFIRITDPLDPALDPASFKLLCSSHPCTWKITGKGILEFRFNSIFLADSLHNEPASHGFVKFSLKPKVWMPINTSIYNTANIYFDYNEPVQTNTARTTIGLVRKTTAEMEQAPPPMRVSLQLAPNPTSDFVIVETPEASGYLQLINAQGEVVKRQEVLKSITTVDVHGAPNGMYHLIWNVSNGLKVGKVAIQR